MAKSTDVRFQVELSPATVLEMEEIMSDCGLSTKKELFNNAFTLFQWAVTEIQKGNVIASVDETNERYKELQMPVLNAAANKARGQARKIERNPVAKVPSVA